MQELTQVLDDCEMEMLAKDNEIQDLQMRLDIQVDDNA